MRIANRALYRSRQFFGSVRPRIDETLRTEAFALLNDGERAVFESMTPRDQQHCLAVYRKLLDEGNDDRDLLVAALLHDAGKGRIELWHRVAYVVLAAATPGLLDRVVRPGEGPGWREALYRCHHHPELGAELARDAGSSDRVVRLIREEDDALLGTLHAADEAV